MPSSRISDGTRLTISKLRCMFFVVTFVIAQCRADPVLDTLCPETLLQSSKCVPKKISTVKKKAINE